MFRLKAILFSSICLCFVTGRPPFKQVENHEKPKSQAPIPKLDSQQTLTVLHLWHRRAYGGVLGVYGTKLAARLPAANREWLERCLRGSPGLPDYARCLKHADRIARYYAFLRTRRVSRSRHVVRAKRQIRRLALRPAQQKQEEASVQLAKFLENGVNQLRRILKLQMAKSNKKSQLDPELLEILTESSEDSWRSDYRRLKRYLMFNPRLFQQLSDLKAQNPLVPPAQPANDAQPQPTIEGDVTKFANEILSSLTANGASLPNSKRILSPRLFPVIPDGKDSIISPDVLGFFRDDGAVASLPDLMAHMGPSEQDAWMGLLMEATGAGKLISGLTKDLFNTSSPNRVNLSAIFGSNFLDRLQYWDAFLDTFSDRELQTLNDDGYRFLREDQIDFLYGDDGILKDFLEGEVDVQAMKAVSKSEKEQKRYLKRMIGEIADSQGFITPKSAIRGNDSILIINSTLQRRSNFHKKRLKDSASEPASFSPVILEPGVLGPLVLSPSLFNPVILSPSALGGLYLSPEVGGPDILSPYALAPAILSPTVMNPYILSPYALSPLILSPEVMNPYVLNPQTLSPVILSPGVMVPLVLSPSALSPIILSPAVLSPGVLSPSSLSDAILSPTVLSKK